MQEYAKYICSEVKEFMTLGTMNRDLLILSEQYRSITSSIGTGNMIPMV